MAEHVLPRYPIYIPSKGRHDVCHTGRFLVKDGVPFRLVVEPQESTLYATQFGAERLLVLPFNNQGLIAARNWIKEHAISEGYARHWQLDDNIRLIHRRWHGKRIPCNAGPALRAVEDFVDRYENVALAGLDYPMFVADGERYPPFFLNAHVYSCTLVLNSIPHRWRLRYNDDTDLCPQVLADGWCTVLVNAFLADKERTMTVKGGNTADLYQGDGRLRMARALERVWPGVVSVDRRFKRPQHVIKGSWKRFDTPLRLRTDIVQEEHPLPDEYAMRLVQVGDEVRGEKLRPLWEQEQARASANVRKLDGQLGERDGDGDADT